MNKDIIDLLAVAAGPARHDIAFMATVTRTSGSSYRRPGARMLIGSSSRLAGSVSGGCLERDLVKRASWLARDGAVHLRFDTSADADESELHYLGCGGSIEILLEPLDLEDDMGAIALLEWAVARREPVGMATVAVSAASTLRAGTRVAITAGDVRAGPEGLALLEHCRPELEAVLRSRQSSTMTLSVDGREVSVLLEALRPRRQFLVVGRHHDVAPVVTIASMLGWDVTVSAGAPARELGNPARVIAPTPEAIATWGNANIEGAAVVMTHSVALDREALAALLCSEHEGHVGLLGPSHRASDIATELEKRTDISQQKLEAVQAPAGLPLGGDGPEAVALSIVSGAQAWFEKRERRGAWPSRQLSLVK